jgi:predicted methyltransferase MtxX (methanogen marker protein 4)
MLESTDDVFSRFHPLVAAEPAVVIRAARDADLPSLHDLAELDSAVPLTGRVLVALVDGRPWAAVGLDDGRTIADPFRASGAAVELLRLRVAQLGAAEGRGRRWLTLRRGRARRW